MGNRFEPGLTENLAGAASIAITVLLSPLLRPWYSHWGATRDERQRELPGDELVPQPRLETTRAITIRASAEEIWPWLAQLGQGRGGFYSYDALENLARCDIHSADHILPDGQHVQRGDQVRLGPEGYPFYVVAAVQPDHALLLKTPTGANGVWVFVLDEQRSGVTRLIARTRLDYEPSLANTLIWRGFTDPIAFVMERKMLQGIRARAEAHRT